MGSTLLTRVTSSIDMFNPKGGRLFCTGRSLNASNFITPVLNAPTLGGSSRLSFSVGPPWWVLKGNQKGTPQFVWVPLKRHPHIFVPLDNWCGTMLPF